MPRTSDRHHRQPVSLARPGQEGAGAARSRIPHGEERVRRRHSGRGARRRRHARHLRQAAAATLRRAEEMQGDRPLRPRRRQYRPAGGEGARHRRQLRAGLLPARSVGPRHGAAAGARPQGDVRQQARAIRPLGGAAARAAAPPRRPGAGPGRLRQHSARAGAEGQGVRIEGPHLRSLRERGRARRDRRRKRKLRRFARRAPISSRCMRRCSRRRAA